MKYFLIGIAFVVSFAFACSDTKSTNSPSIANMTNASSPATSPLPSATIDELASGRRIYEVSCAGCHKDDGTGGPMEIEGTRINPDDLTSAKIKAFSDEKILGYVMNGVPDEGMPAFKGKLSEAEMRDVVKYVRTEIQKMPGNGSPPKS